MKKRAIAQATADELNVADYLWIAQDFATDLANLIVVSLKWFFRNYFS